MTASALSLRGFGLAQRRGDGELVLLDKVDLDVPTGRFLLLLGQSGGGKSSLIRFLAGLIEPREPALRVRGEVHCLGRPLHDQNPSRSRPGVAAILQDEGLLDDLSVRENIELALRAAGKSPRLAPALLAQVGLDPAPEHVAQLSGGMRKRVAVARALAAQPLLLLCDEPTAGLDPVAARTIAMLLHRSHREHQGRTTIVVTHEPATFAGLADGALILDQNARTLHLRSDAAGWNDRQPPSEHGIADTADMLALHGLQRLLLELAAIGETVVESLLRLPPVHPRQVVRSVFAFATGAVLFAAIGAATVGGLSAFFALRNNPIQSGFESALLTGTGKVLTAVLVPLLCGFFFTARVAAGAAARIGTMQRSQQIAALRLLGVRPSDYLLTPLVWGMVVALPVVTAVGIVSAAFAGLLATRMVSGIATSAWAMAWFAAMEAWDLRLVLAKSALSGWFVALATWHLATGPKRSGAEVGEAVNAAVVVGMGLVLLVHGSLTLWAYA